MRRLLNGTKRTQHHPRKRVTDQQTDAKHRRNRRQRKPSHLVARVQLRIQRRAQPTAEFPKLILSHPHRHAPGRLLAAQAKTQGPIVGPLPRFGFGQRIPAQILRPEERLAAPAFNLKIEDARVQLGMVFHRIANRFRRVRQIHITEQQPHFFRLILQDEIRSRDHLFPDERTADPKRQKYRQRRDRGIEADQPETERRPHLIPWNTPRPAPCGSGTSHHRPI